MYLYILDIEKNVSNICKTERKRKWSTITRNTSWLKRDRNPSPPHHTVASLRFALSILTLIPPNSWIRRLCYNKPSKTCLHIAPTVSSNFQEDAALQSVLKLHHFHDVLSQNILCSLLIESKHTLHSGSVWHQAINMSCWSEFVKEPQPSSTAGVPNNQNIKKEKKNIKNKNRSNINQPLNILST